MTLLAMFGFDDLNTPEPGMNFGGSQPGRTGVGRSANWSTTFSAIVMSTAANVAVSQGTMVVFGFGAKSGYSAQATDLYYLCENNLAISHIRIAQDSAGHLIIKRGDNTVLATSTYILDNSIWHYWEIKAVIADSGGMAEVRIDNSVVATVSGVDTRNGGSGIIDSFQSTNVSGGIGMYLDDMYVLDGNGAAPYNNYLGDCKVETLFPNADGDSSQFVGSDGNSVNNYALVNESPPDTTTFVSSATPGERDLYNLQDLATTVGTVLAVQPSHYASKSDAGVAPGLRGVLKGQSGTVKTLPAIPALATGQTLTQGSIELTDPDGSAWSIAKVNGLQVGQETF